MCEPTTTAWQHQQRPRRAQLMGVVEVRQTHLLEPGLPGAARPPCDPSVPGSPAPRRSRTGLQMYPNAHCDVQMDRLVHAALRGAWNAPRVRLHFHGLVMALAP